MNWFNFKPEKITGWGYFGRSIVGMIGFILIIPGFWLIASTAYKRAAAFNHSKNFNIFCAIIMPIHWLSELLLRIEEYERIFDQLLDYLVLSLGFFYLISIIPMLFIPVLIHIYLFLFNGNKIKTINSR